MNTITAYQCVQCNHVMYPHHLRCLNCNGRVFNKITPSGKASLITFTVINELPWGIDERGRVVGIVEFENGVKAMGLVKADPVRIGMRLNASWDVVRIIGGERVRGLVFEPAG